MDIEIGRIDYSKEPAYFLHLAEDWNVDKFPTIWVTGDVGLLKCELVALFCSRKCPGKIIRKSHDFAEELRMKGIPVIGGFQTQVEKMCLEVLLKGEQPVVVCPARGITGMRVPAEWSGPIKEGRLLVVSPFSPSHRRPTRASAGLRNRFVAAAADRLFFLHAAPKSRTLTFAEELLSEGRELETFDVSENDELKKAGARIVE